MTIDFQSKIDREHNSINTRRILNGKPAFRSSPAGGIKSILFHLHIDETIINPHTIYILYIYIYNRLFGVALGGRLINASMIRLSLFTEHTHSRVCLEYLDERPQKCVKSFLDSSASLAAYKKIIIPDVF